MTFRDPALLWLALAALLVPAGLWLERRQGRRILGALGTERVVRTLLKGETRGLAAVSGALLTFGALGLTVALAGPRAGSRTELLRKRGLDVVVALDFSKSMLAADVRPSRIERAKNEVRRLMAAQRGDRVGFVAFAGDTMEFPMTTDASAMDLFLRDLGPRDMPVGGTAIGRALVASGRLLERARTAREAAKQPGEGAPSVRDRVVVLITDGEDHEGDPLAAAQELKTLGVRVYTIGVGSRAGEPIPTYAPDGTWTGYLTDAEGNTVHTAFSEAAEETLRKASEVTGGKFFRAEDGSLGMDGVRAELAKLKQAEEKQREIRIYDEVYVWALLPAFLLLLLEFLLPRARLPRAAERDSALPSAKGVVGAAVAALVLLAAAPALAWEPLRSENRHVRDGNRALAAKKADDALAAYDRAARELPSEPGVFLNRGLALLAKGEREKARTSLEVAAEAGAPREVRARALAALGLSHFQDGDALAQEEKHDEASGAFRRAAEALKKSLRTQPGQADVAWNYELAKRRITESEKKASEQRESEANEEKQNPDPTEGEKDQASEGGEAGPEQPDAPKNPDDTKAPSEPESKQDGADGEPKQDQAKGGSEPEESARQPGEPEPPAQKQQPDQPGQPAQPPPAQPAPDATQAPEPREGPELPAHMRRALDALRDGEENLEKYRARARARREPRRVEKDW